MAGEGGGELGKEGQRPEKIFADAVMGGWGAGEGEARVDGKRGWCADNGSQRGRGGEG